MSGCFSWSVLLNLDRETAAIVSLFNSKNAEIHPRGTNRPFTNKNPDSAAKMHKLWCHFDSGPVIGLMDGGPQINLPMRRLNNTASDAGTYIHIRNAVEKHRGRKSLGRTISTAD